MSKSMIAWIIVFCLFFVFSAKRKASGHAHIWVHSAVILHFDDDGFAGFKCEWVFDEMFSNMIVHDFDKNDSGVFEQLEVEEILRGAFSNLKEFGYFLHVKINDKKFAVKFVKGFNVKIVKDLVIYHFFVPCHVRAISSFKEIRIGIYDESFYTSIVLLKDQILIQNDLGYEYQLDVELNKNDPYYYGQVYPEEIVLRFRKRNE